MHNNMTSQNIKAYKQMQIQQQNNNKVPNRQVWLMDFKDKCKIIRALSNKVQDIEYFQKHGKPYQYGNNEDFIIIGQQLLEFFFVDFMTIRGYPNPATQCKKASDIIGTRQKILSDKNLSQLALHYNLNEMVLTGKQTALKTNPKVLAETLKAVIGGQYVDKDYDLEHMRAVLKPCYEFLLEKGQVLVANTTSTNYKSQFYEMIADYKLIPKLSCEWRMVEKLEGQQDTIYTYTLEIDGLYKHSVEGLTKRQTEETLFKHCMSQMYKTKTELDRQINNKTDNNTDNITDNNTTFNLGIYQLEVEFDISVNSVNNSIFLDDLHNQELETKGLKNNHQSETQDNHKFETQDDHEAETQASNNSYQGRNSQSLLALDTDNMLDQIIK